MKIKKIYSCAMALVLAGSMMAACGNSSNVGNTGTPTPSASGQPSASPSGTAEGERTKDGIMYTEGVPIVDEKDSFSFTLFVDDSQEDDDYVILDLLEKQTGIKVELMKYPYAVAQEKLALQLNSGDYADCIGGWTLSANSILTYGMEEGVFIPLEEYFEKYCPKITEILNLEGVRETMTTPDGHIYSIPYALSAPEVSFNPYINTTWLKNVGMEMPTTTEELREVLRAFKTKDANGNGNPNDEIPFTTGPDNKHLGELAGWFGMSVNDEGFTMVDGKLAFGANTEEYKNGIKFLASLYAEGLIDNEMFTQDSAQWKAKGGQNLYGVSIMYGSGDIMPYDAGTKPEWEPLPVLKGSDSVKPVFLRETYGTTVLKNQVVITDNAKNPEIICRWWDNLFELENSIQTHNGPLGITLIKGDDGSYTRIDTSKTFSEADQKLYDWGNLFPQSLPRYVPNGFKIKEEVETYQEKPVVDALYAPFLTEAIPQYWAKAEDATKLADLSTAIKDYITQKKAEWISGQTDIDKDWDAYLAQLEKLKLQELIEIRTSVLN